MIMAGNGTSPVVGELKTSWLPTHDLVAIVRSFELGDDENSFRQILGKDKRHFRCESSSFNTGFRAVISSLCFCDTCRLREYGASNIRALFLARMCTMRMDK